jgi:hypothetical protein
MTPDNERKISIWLGKEPERTSGDQIFVSPLTKADAMDALEKLSNLTHVNLIRKGNLWWWSIEIWIHPRWHILDGDTPTGAIFAAVLALIEQGEKEQP